MRKRRRRSRPEDPGAAAPAKGDAARRDPLHRGGAGKGATGRKVRRRTQRPQRGGSDGGATRPKGRGKVLMKGKMIFRRPGRAKGKR